ncbi:MAG TPA: AsmA-like C-terminal region-containing protein [Sphingobacteriaceae bacterium]|nr:AsmA-like C-terminal region-containing protein [Sphingobacteriaceae bacterium]
MKRNINIAAKIIGGLLGLILVVWIGVSLYVRSHKKDLLNMVTKQLNENINGSLTIESMEPELVRGFPGISVSLKNVVLRDSLWENHKHNLLQAKNVYVALDAFSLFNGSPNIKKISIEDAEIYLYSDSLGHSNTNLFKSKSPKGNKKGKGKINRVDLNKVHLTYDNKFKNKYFNFDISNFTGKINYTSTGWKGTIDLKTLVNQLEFNTRVGSFLKNKNLVAKLDIEFNDKEKKLTLPTQTISIEKDDIDIGGYFMFAETSSDFHLDIKAKNISFAKASTLLLPRVTKRLQSYKLKKPLDVQTIIKGQLKGKAKQPLVTATWQVKNNTLTSLGEVINNCSFTGVFTNEYVPGKGRTDINSVITLNNLTGSWSDIDFKAQKVEISNLTRPIIEGKFTSNFPLKKLNAVSGGNTFHFDGGSAALNLLYKAPFFQSDASKKSYILGTIRINQAAATYRPRNLKFNNTSLLLNFKGHDLFLQNMRVNSGKTTLLMDGSLRNFLNLYYTDPKKIILDWRISSPELNLGEYLAFLGKRSTTAKPVSNTGGGAGKIFKQLDQVLDQANVHMVLKVNKLIYKKFTADNVVSNITLKQSGIGINQVSLSHGGGNLVVTGNIDQSGSLNKIFVDTRLTNVDVKKLFTAFENFGQNAITDQNLRGVFFGSTKMAASMKNNGEIVPRSFRGSVNFDLRNGALVNFVPIKKVGKFAFPNRDFSNITFQSLKNTLTIEGNKVIIPPMKIETSVLNIFVDGVYSFSSGTNIALQVPLRNPKKDEFMTDSLKETRAKRGIVLNLLAVDGDDGNVKIKLGKKDSKNEN